jgi:hypothetical protein
MATEKNVSIFCGGRATAKEKDNREIVSCPKCKRETDLDTYQIMYDKWLGDIREDG